MGTHRGTEGCVMEKPLTICINLIAYRVLISSLAGRVLVPSWECP